ncbi:hypothetical protein [Vreelandella massiliensis]|uniref:hypothetical protein n=1 Tax=Vreelandella massiliensis TaxID=1816686 RepID=UPI00096A4D74|nr:hypothetical protein [Halomonas massiliensis]
MRWIGRIFLLALLSALLVAGYHALRPFWQLPTSLPALVKTLDLETHTTRVYFLSGDEWLTFPLINRPSQVRLLTHAGVAPDTPREAELRYTLVYEVLDDKRRLLKRGRYTHETRLPPRLEKAGTPVPPYLYAEQELSVASGQAFNLNLKALPDAAYLKLRAEPLTEPLRNLALRFYREERQSPREAAVEWERLAQAERERLSEAIIAPPVLLSEQEKRHLLQTRWRPTAPLGTRPPQGRLFSVEGLESTVDPALTVQAPGRYIDRKRFGVVPIPASGDYVVQFRDLENGGAPLRLTFHQLTEELEPARLESLELPRALGRMPRHFEKGLVLVQSNRPGLLDIFPAESPHTSALPEPLYLRAHQAGQGGVNYRLTPNEHHRTPLRLDLRAFGQGVPLPAQTPTEATYRFYDAQDKLLEQGELTPSLPPSAFDRVASTPAIADTSQPASFFFRLSPQVSRVEITSDDSVLVSAYTRPPDLAHTRRVPEDYYPWKGDASPRPRWFLLDPLPAGTATTQSVVLHLQSSPPERNPALLAGDYAWEGLEPQRGAHGARLLLPAENLAQLRPQGLPVYFQPLAEDRGNEGSGSPKHAIEASVVFETPLADHRIEPELIYLRDSAEPFRLSVRLGGQRREHLLSGRRGSLLLPSTATGRQSIALDSSSAGEWLLNYRYPNEEGYIRRLGYRLKDQPLHFTLPAHPEASRLIGARFYRTQPNRPSVIHARLNAGRLASGPVTAWTNTEQRYIIRPEGATRPQGYVLDHQSEDVADGQMLLFELGEDLPEGPFELTFTRESGGPGYLVVYEILPGEYKRIQTFTEQSP